MTVADPTNTLRRSDIESARAQLWLSCLVFAIVGLAVVVAQVMVRHDQWLLYPRLELWKQANQTYVDGRFYPNTSERNLYNVLPDTDCSRGGVYFVGSSPTEQALMSWAFPAELQPVRNYSFAGARYTTESRFVHCLVEEHHVLAAGGDKTLVVLELSFADTPHDATPMQIYMDDVWSGYFTRYGLYEFDDREQLHMTAMSPLRRRFEIESLRTHVFWSWLFRKDEFLKPPAGATDMEVRQNWMDRMGPQWESGMDAELQALGQLIDYLKAHHADVAAVYFPQPTWESTFAPALRFRERIMPLMAAKAVPVVDLIHQFPDSFFVDSVHLNYQGSAAIQPFLIELARQHFEKHRRQ